MSAVEHGGNLGEARRLFPQTAEPWIDLSTGINPWPYPIPAIPAHAWAALPSPDDTRELEAVAAQCYGAPFDACVVAVPGTQAAIQWLPHLFATGSVAILRPTYTEHVRAWTLAGHQVLEAQRWDEMESATIGVIVNPNNPDGSYFGREELLALAAEKHAKGGVLILDEAFADAMPQVSLASMAGTPGLIMLRSFGKFFGLAGIRLGFVLAEPSLTGRLREAMGAWAVSGEAIVIGRTALADILWQNGTRTSLRTARQELDTDLAAAGTIIGGTDLYRLLQTPHAPALFRQLGGAGIWVRHFADHPRWLRFGLPPHAAAHARLRAVLKRYHNRETHAM
jgi:cobalamin biosynthesis protein CobC